MEKLEKSKLSARLKPSIFRLANDPFSISQLKQPMNIALLVMIAALESALLVVFAPISFSVPAVGMEFRVASIIDTPLTLLFGYPGAIGTGMGIFIWNCTLGYGFLDGLNGGILHTILIRMLVVAIAKRFDKDRNNVMYHLYAFYTSIVAALTVAVVIKYGGGVPVPFWTIATLWLLPSMLFVQHVFGFVLFSLLKDAGIHMVPTVNKHE